MWWCSTKLCLDDIDIEPSMDQSQGKNKKKNVISGLSSKAQLKAKELHA